ncbi:MAG: TetR/AcrR family transcriptional regulator [Ignavibacteria bacterium]|nr:TetR/AcrR family transcriptional regulator [Ignavibacteria bacterium]
MEKDEDVKKSILDASRIVFQKWGLNKSTMEDIARETGKGKSTLYYYFKNKEEIFETIAKQEFTAILIKVQSVIKLEKSAKEKLKLYLITMIKEIKNTVSIYPLAKGELKANKHFLNEIQKYLADRQEDIVMEILIEGQKSGELNYLKANDLKKAADVLIGIVRALSLYLFFDVDDDEQIDIAVKFITSGI